MLSASKNVTETCEFYMSEVQNNDSEICCLHATSSMDGTFALFCALCIYLLYLNQQKWFLFFILFL